MLNERFSPCHICSVTPHPESPPQASADAALASAQRKGVAQASTEAQIRAELERLLKECDQLSRKLYGTTSRKAGHAKIVQAALPPSVWA